MNDLVKATQYSEEFKFTWERKPNRHIPDNKKSAYKAWCKRLKEGYTPKQMAVGVSFYGKSLAAQNRIGTEYVKMLSTFFGPDLHFMDYQEEAPKIPATSSPGVAFGKRKSEHKAISLMDQLADKSWAL